MDSSPPNFAATPGEPALQEGISTAPIGGAVHQPLYMVRRVKVYPILENELTTLDVLSREVTESISVVTLIVGFLMSIVWDMMTSPDDSKRKIGLPVALVCLLVIAVGIYRAWHSHGKRTTYLNKILEQSTILDLAGQSHKAHG